MAEKNTRQNPYVGPRAFTTGETLYGRDRELRDLVDLLIAERIVLLYSPSGAGKSSLIQAGLIPRLLEENFHVLPVIRLNYEPPEDYEGGGNVNRYTFSAIQSLEEAQIEGDQSSPKGIPGLSLDDFLIQRTNREEDPETEVLIIDQFEEVISIDVTDQDAKHDFFQQLGTALRDRNRWALFSIREDFVGALAPYLRPIPTRFSNVFRLELLGKESARQAIQHPAKEAGVGFEIEAVSRLVDDLRRTRIQRPDGSTEEQLGSFVEPVQLQVVCFRLWENLPRDTNQITLENIESIGSVDTALADYFADRIRQIAGETGVSERSIRDWFENQLITEQGLRGQVLMGPENSGGLDNQAIRLLGDAHLIRAEQRGGATWFELAHDRLIEPVQQNNAIWLETHLSLLQRQAALWDSQGRPDSLLLKDQALHEAQKWASNHSEEMSQVDSDYLEDSQVELERQLAEERALEAKRLRRWIRLVSGIGALAVALAIIAGFLGYQANQFRSTAEQQRDTAQSRATEAIELRIAAETSEAIAKTEEASARFEEAKAKTAEAEAESARALADSERVKAEEAEATAAANEQLARSRELAALSLNVLERQPDSAYLLALEALLAADTLQARNALLSGLQFDHNWVINPIDTSTELASLNTVAFSADGESLAVGGDQGYLHVWNNVNNQFTHRFVRNPVPDESNVNSAAFSTDGLTLFTGHDNGAIKTFDVSSGTKKFADRRYRVFGVDYAVKAVAVSPDDKTLATAGTRGDIPLWDADDQDDAWGVFSSTATRADVESIAWSPDVDDLHLIVGHQDGYVQIYGLNIEKDNGSTDDKVSRNVKLSEQNHSGSVNSVAWSGDGKWFASGGEKKGAEDNNLILWEWNTRSPIPIDDHPEDVGGIAFSPNSKILAVGYKDGALILYDVISRTKIIQLTDDSDDSNDPISDVAFNINSEGATILVTTSEMNKLRFYDVITDQPLGSQYAAGRGNVQDLQFLSNQNLLMLEVQGNNANLLSAQIDQNDLFDNLFSVSGNPSAMAISPDGQKIILGYESSTIILWESQQDGQFIEIGNKNLGKGPIYSLAFAQDSDWVAAGMCNSIEQGGICEENIIQLFVSDPSLSMRGKLEGSTGKVTSVAFNPRKINDPFLVSGTQDQKINFWATDGDNRYAITNELHFSTGLGFTSLAFDSAGSLLSAGNNAGEVILIDVNTLSQYGDRFIGSGDPVTALAFSTDSQVLASGTETGNVIFWDLNKENWVDRVCELAGKTLSEDEMDRLDQVCISLENTR